MKKISTIMMTFLIIGGLFSSYSIQAQGEDIEDASNFMKFSGIIEEIEQGDGSMKLVVENPDNDLLMIFPINDEVKFYSSSTTDEFSKDMLKTGLQVDVYYDKFKPMPLIYPATITPDIVIVNEQQGQVKISKFDENDVSLDNELKFQITDETILMDENGETIEEADLAGKELIVFYTFSTRSIPAQTTPSKIIAIDESVADQLEEVNQIVDEDHYMINDTKMIPIRKVAEFLGYEVEWLHDSYRVIITKQNRSFDLSIGEEMYGFNRSIGYFDTKPEIKESKTYVPVEFVEKLMSNE